MNNDNLPEFDSAPAAPPKRQRKQTPKKTRTIKKRALASAVKSISTGPAPKRARKKRPPRRLPRPIIFDGHSSNGPVLAPEGAAVITQFSKLDDAQKVLVMNYIQAFR